MLTKSTQFYFGNYFKISHKMLAEMHDLPTFSLGNTSVNLKMTSREREIPIIDHCRLCFEFMAGGGGGIKINQLPTASEGWVAHWPTEDLRHSSRYASCVHAGGRRTFLLINKNRTTNNLLNNINFIHHTNEKLYSDTDTKNYLSNMGAPGPNFLWIYWVFKKNAA